MNNPNGLYCCKCSNPLTICTELSGWSLVDFIFFCYLLWWIMYFFLLVITKQSAEWCCRIVTFFHGCLISYHALRDVYINKSHNHIDFKRNSLSASKKNYLSYMFSYFLFDFCWIHFLGNETTIIYLHHIASILIIFNVLIKNIGGSGIAYGAAGLEITNPYLQLRWFLRTHGYQDTLIHKIVELWFVTLFFIIRVFGGTALAYTAIVKSEVDFITKLSFTFIYGISMVLQWQILVFVRKKYILPGNRVLFTRSRISISLYFQRRTLDRFQGNFNEQNQEEPGARKQLSLITEPTLNAETPVSKEPSIKEISPSKEFSLKEESSDPLPPADEDNEALFSENNLEESANPDEETEQK